MSRQGPGFTPGEKPASFGGVWKKIFQYMGRYRYAFYAAIAMSIVGTALSLIGPNKISDLTDVIKDGLAPGSTIDMEAVASIGTFLVILYAVSAMLLLVQNILMSTITQKTAGRLRDNISEKVNKVPLGFFDKSSTGDLMSRVTNDADSMGQSMNQGLGMMISSLVLVLGSLVMMFVTNAIMAVTAVLCTVLGLVLMVVMVKLSQKHFNRQQEYLGGINGHVSETYSSHVVVKAFGGEEEATEEFDEINNNLTRSAFLAQYISGTMMPITGFIGNLGYVMVCIVGAVLVIDGTATIGTIVAFMIYIRLFTQPLGQMAQALNSMQNVAAGAERVFGFLEEEELSVENPDNHMKKARGHVEFRDVHFGYVPGKEIIKGFSAEIMPGQKVAIVGPTGAGKTTIVNLLMRFYDVDSGSILIDGVPISSMSRENVHEQFCMVLQDAWLFEGSVKENIVYNREGITDEQVRNACEAVGLDRFIRSLPDGYDTVLGEMAELSAGQKQQMVIARAMIDDSPMLIFDEATSSVDTRTEKTIQESLDRLSSDRTSFVIAHRLSTIRNSDLILVMKDGNVIEQGDHDALMAKGGFYSDLYNSQFENAEES